MRAKVDTEKNPADSLMIEALGTFFLGFGFKRNVGRVWAVLYLRGLPVDQNDLRQALSVSVGMVSAALKELMYYGAVRQVYMPRERRIYYQAEQRLLPIVASILTKREMEAVRALRAACYQARMSSSGGPGAARLVRRMKAIEDCVDLYEALTHFVSTVANMPDVALRQVVRIMKSGAIWRRMVGKGPSTAG